ncbi:hypothetical protein PR048_027649 [Dryococelus australis]|uniref:Uncharacterized protein n=1 Tax=Dryococelus australis TaxID=614101 RepID=A0ABQ9GH41_9NEOP|nr:hypothetical protein PR048_027649 [Dryococelus australis]
MNQSQWSCSEQKTRPAFLIPFGLATTRADIVIRNWLVRFLYVLPFAQFHGLMSRDSSEKETTVTYKPYIIKLLQAVHSQQPNIAVCLVTLLMRQPRLNMKFVANMEQRRNEGAGETGEPRENPPANGIVRNDSHLRKSDVAQPGIEPGSPWWEASVLIAQPPWKKLGIFVMSAALEAAPDRITSKKVRVAQESRVMWTPPKATRPRRERSYVCQH